MESKLNYTVIMRDRAMGILLFSVVTLTFLACVTKSNEGEAPPGESYPSLTEDGAWCWFSDPRAIYFEGQHKRTYAAWVDSAGSVLVGFYDHDLKSVEKFVLHQYLEKDDHNNPSLFIDKEGRLMVFYSRHAGREPIFFRRAKMAEDLLQWEAVRKLILNDSVAYPGLSNTYTYTNICQLSGEEDKLYLFWRGADFKPNVSVSVDGGNSWSPGKILILPDRIYKNRRPYLKVSGNHKDAIHFAFTDGHPNAEPTNSIYYAKYWQGAFYKANGEKIINWSALPLRPSRADLVYDATSSKEKAWIWDVAENSEGQPVMVYARFPADSSHVYYYSIWDNDQWNHYELVHSGPWFPQTPPAATEREPDYSGGIVLDHKNPGIVYLSRRKNGKFEIEKWTSVNKGKDWSVTEITKDSELDNVRPFVIRNHPSSNGPIVLWMNVQKYVHYTDYRTAIKMDVR